MALNKIIWLMLLGTVLAACSVASKQSNAPDALSAEDIFRYQSTIREGFDRDVLDYNDPYLLTWLLFKMEEPIARWSMEGEQPSADTVMITLIREGFMDDSVYGDKRVITYVKEEGKWEITSIMLGIKCQANRGQQTFGTALCR
jgi:hypothetical protein